MSDYYAKVHDGIIIRCPFCRRLSKWRMTVEEFNAGTHECACETVLPKIEVK